MKNLGDRLKYARENKGVSQVQVSKDTGINNKTLSGYERSISEPDMETILTLAGYYNVSLEYLLGKTKEMKLYKENSRTDTLLDFLRIEAQEAGFDINNKTNEEIAELLITILKIKEMTKSN